MSEPDNLAVELIKRFEREAKRRSVWENTWRDIALRIAPQEEMFFNGSGQGAGKTLADARFSAGARKDQFQFDSYPTQAWEKYAAALHYYNMPEAQRWLKLKSPIKALNKDRYVARFFDEFTDALIDTFYSMTSMFNSATHSAFLSNGLYGIGTIFVEDRLSKGIGFQPLHASQVYPVENAYGQINEMMWPYTLTAIQAAEKFGIENLPREIREAASNMATWDKEFKFLYVCRENNNPQPGRRDWAGMRYIAYDIALEAKQIIKRGGYRTFPFPITRHITLPRQVYALSPAFICLADVKTLNEMMKTNIRYAQNTNDPPIMLQDVDSLRPFTLRSGWLNYGYLNEDGKPTAVPFQTNGDPRFAIEMMDQKRQAIQATFYNTLFDILVQSPEMTATQALIRSQEKGALLAPVVSRQRTEFLNVLISRTAQILEDSGVIPTPPDALLEYGGGISIEYDNPLTRAQKAEEGAGFLQTFQAATQLQPFDPNVMKRIDLDKGLQYLAMVYSCPNSLIRSDDEYQQAVEEEAQRINAMEQAQMALGATQGIKNLAQAQAATTRNQSGA
jgi:hypothetical protein